MSNLSYIDEAERNDDGDLVYEKTVELRTGETYTESINLSKLMAPGERRTGDMDIFVIEAENVAEGTCRGNPALPVNDRVAERVIEELERRGLEPAWRVVEYKGWSE